MTHEAMQSFLGVYALDAIDAEESIEIEGHLHECPRCRGEVEAFRQTASWLSHEGGDAPPGVWDKVSASLEEPPPPLRLVTRRPPGRDRRRRLVAIAAVIVTLVAGISFVEQQGGRLAGRSLAAQAALALDTPGARVARLTGPSSGMASAVVEADGHGYLLASRLPPLDRGVYQLWGATAGGGVGSMGTIAGPGTYAMKVGPDVRVVMVTVEDHAQVAPTSPAIVTGSLA